MTSPPRGRRTTTRSKTQILFLVQNVAYDNKFIIDYEVVKDQLPEEWHLVPTKPPHPKKIPVQTAQKKTTPSETRRTGQVAARMVSYGGQDRKVEQNKPQNVWARHQASQREDWEELPSRVQLKMHLQARQPHHHRGTHHRQPRDHLRDVKHNNHSNKNTILRDKQRYRRIKN